MTPSGSGPGDASVEVPSTRQRRSTLGKIGMILSFVPLAIVAARIILRPG